MTAARKMLAYLKENPQPEKLIDAARRLIFLKGKTRTITSSARPFWKITTTSLRPGATVTWPPAFQFTRLRRAGQRTGQTNARGAAGMETMKLYSAASGSSARAQLHSP